MGKHRQLKLRDKQKQNDRPFVPDETARQERILPVIAALKSANVQDRLAHLGAISALVDDSNLRQMLLRERVIKIILTNILSDSSLEVVAEGLGVLRNIVLAEGRDPALYISREGVKTTINHLATKLQAQAGDLNGLKGDDLRVMTSLVENTCGLASAIVMVTYDVVNWLDVTNLAFLVVTQPALAAKLAPAAVNAAFELLYYLSEDEENDEFLEKFGGDVAAVLQKVAASTNSWDAKIYSLGILFNRALLMGDLGSCLADILEFWRDAPPTELNSRHIALDLLALGAQTEDPTVLSQFIPVLSSLRETMATSSEFRLPAIRVHNNVNWSRAAVGEDWSEEAGSVFSDTMRSKDQFLADEETASAALGLLASIFVQDGTLALSPEFRGLIAPVFSQIETLYSSGNPIWEDLARSLVVVLGSREVAGGLDRVSDTTQLIFMLLEHACVEAKLDAISALFSVHGDNDASFNASEYVAKGLHERLIGLKPLLKKSLKSVPKSDEALRHRALEALGDYDQFLEYKQS